MEYLTNADLALDFEKIAEISKNLPKPNFTTTVSYLQGGGVCGDVRCAKTKGR